MLVALVMKRVASDAVKWVSYYTYVVDTMGGSVWYAVTVFPWRTGRLRMKIMKCSVYRNPS